MNPRWVLLHRGLFGLWWWRLSFEGRGVELFGHLPRWSRWEAEEAIKRRCGYLPDVHPVKVWGHA